MVRPPIYRPPPNLLPDPWVRNNFAVRYANLSTAFILIEEHLSLSHPTLMVPWEDIIFVFPSFVLTDPYCQSFAQWYPPNINPQQNQTESLSASSTSSDPAAANSNQHPAPETDNPQSSSNPATETETGNPSHLHRPTTSQSQSQPRVWDTSKIRHHPIRLSEWPMKWINNLLIIMETFRSIKSTPLFGSEEGFNTGERDPFALWYLAAACAQKWTRGPCEKWVGTGDDEVMEKDISAEELRMKTEEVYWEARKVNGNIWWEYYGYFYNMVEHQWWEVQIEAWNQSHGGIEQVERGVQNHERGWVTNGVEDGVEYYEEEVVEDNVGDGWEEGMEGIVEDFVDDGMEADVEDNLPDDADNYVEEQMNDNMEDNEDYADAHVDDHADDHDSQEVRYDESYDSGCCGMKEDAWKDTSSRNADDDDDTSSDDEAVLTPSSESGIEEID